MNTPDSAERREPRRGLDVLRLISEIEWLAQRLEVPGHAARIAGIATRIARFAPENSIAQLAGSVESSVVNQPGPDDKARLNAAVSRLRQALEKKQTIS